MKVKYNQIKPIESYMCEYNNKIYSTKENLQLFPDRVTIYNAMDKKEYWDMINRLMEALGH